MEWLMSAGDGEADLLLLGDEYDVPPDATAGTGDGEDGIDEDDLEADHDVESSRLL